MVVELSSNESRKAGDKVRNEEGRKRLIVQVYEIQTPEEAALMVELGVNHIGSVIQSGEFWKQPVIRDAVQVQKQTTSKSSIIPLFSDPDTIFRVVEFYRPDILHFCEILPDPGEKAILLDTFIELQKSVRLRFPETKIMRSIPIAQPGYASGIPTLALAEMFEPVSDYFLTDTILMENAAGLHHAQPENGFVGITGKVCDWNTARKMVNQCQIPVVLAGGISPDNVFDGVLKVKPAGVDSCTNTNRIDKNGNPVRFKKDPEKVRKLVAETRRAEMAMFSSPDDPTNE